MPAFILSVLFAILYLHLEAFHLFNRNLTLLLAAVVGVLLSAVIRERKKFFATPFQIVIAFVVFIALLFFHLNSLIVLIVVGLLGALFYAPFRQPTDVRE